MTRVDNEGKVRLYHIGNDLGDDLILSVAKSYRSEGPQFYGIGAFGNQVKVSGVDLFLYPANLESILAKFDNRMTQVILIFLIHKGVYAIRSRSPGCFKREHNPFDLILLRVGFQPIMIREINRPSRGRILLIR